MTVYNTFLPYVHTSKIHLISFAQPKIITKKINFHLPMQENTIKILTVVIHKNDVSICSRFTRHTLHHQQIIVGKMVSDVPPSTCSIPSRFIFVVSFIYSSSTIIRRCKYSVLPVFATEHMFSSRDTKRRMSIGQRPLPIW